MLLALTWPKPRIRSDKAVAADFIGQGGTVQHHLPRNGPTTLARRADRRRPGVVFVGVRDDGTPTGLEINDALLLKLAHCKTDGNILPPPSMTVGKHVLGGKGVAVVIVAPADSPPVRFRGRIRTRVGPRRAPAGAQDERILNGKRRHGERPSTRGPCAAPPSPIRPAAVPVSLSAACVRRRSAGPQRPHGGGTPRRHEDGSCPSRTRRPRCTAIRIWPRRCASAASCNATASAFPSRAGSCTPTTSRRRTSTSTRTGSVAPCTYGRSRAGRPRDRPRR